MLQYHVGGGLGGSLYTAGSVHTYHALSTDTVGGGGGATAATIANANAYRRRCPPTDISNSRGGCAYALCLRYDSIAARSDWTIWNRTEN